MYEKDLEAMIEVALHAQKVIMEIYNTNFEVEIKSDDSPVTQADKLADELIRKELGARFPEYGFLTEESQDTKERLTKEYIFIVDPVDGTKEFVSHNGEFCTNIGLCHNHEIVAGVINLPAQNRLYYGSKGNGAFRLENGERTRLHVSDRKENLRCALSRSFLQPEEVALLDRNENHLESRFKIGAAMKFCMIAEGTADISIRLSSGTKEWDTAAGDIILSEAGGCMVKLDGTRWTYNRENVHNVGGYELLNSIDNLLL